MNSFLKQSTASQSRAIGPFVDSTDFFTAEVGLTIANTDIKLVVNGAASANKNSGGGTHRANGVYGVTFDATDTATVGEMFVSVVVSGALPVFATFVVVEEAVYDALFAASAPGYVANASVNVAQWNGSTVATPAVAGVPKVDLTHWIGTAAATPTVAGVPEVDVTHWLGTAAQGASGRPEVDVELIGGAAVSTTTAQIGVNVVQISTDATAADNAEAFFDGTGYKDVDNLYVIRSATAQAGGASTITLDASASAVDDFYNNTILQIISGTGANQSRIVSDYVGSTKVATVPAWVTTPSSDSVFIIYPFGAIPGATAPTAAETADAVWDELRSGHVTTGTFGEYVNTTGTALGAGAITAATFAAGAITAASIATGAIDADALAADAVTEIQAGLATATEVAKIPKSDGSSTWNATALASLQQEATDALNAYDPPTKAEMDAALAAADDAVLAAIAALNNLSAAQVNAEVVDALNVDTYAEPTGVPAATASLVNKIGRLHQVLRNKLTVTASSKTLHDDSGTALWSKALSDDGTVFTENEGS